MSNLKNGEDKGKEHFKVRALFELLAKEEAEYYFHLYFNLSSFVF